MFEQAAERLALPLPDWRPVRLDEGETMPDERLVFVDCGHRLRIRPGTPSTPAGRASLEYVDVAVDLCRRGEAAALVTAPVTKWAIERSHPNFVGQTEYLAQRFGAPSVAMMFVAESLRIVLLTRHLALREVASRLTQSSVRQTILATVESLRRDFGIDEPRLVVCGVNPHAGEGGLFGTEERRILLPVLRQLRQRGLTIDGPVAADGFFAAPSRYDAVVCAYHDQGLIPFKMQARDRGCQMTVGLPVPRTSPDHGSALDIAGQGEADPGSMIYAIELAATLAERAKAARTARTDGSRAHASSGTAKPSRSPRARRGGS